MIIFQGGFGIGQAAKKTAGAPTLAVIKREYAEAYAALQRLDAALAKGDIKDAQAISKGLSKWAAEATKAVKSNYQLMSRIGGLEYNIDRLVPGTEANLSFVKCVGELNAERKSEVLGYISEGLSYAKENALKAGSLSCLNEALSMKDAKVCGAMLDVMASAQAPEDYLEIFGVKTKAGTPGFFTSQDIELGNRKVVDIMPAGDEKTPRFAEGSPLAQVEELVKKDDFEGARKIVEGKYRELVRPPPIARIELKQISKVEAEASLWGTIRKGGELIVPFWGATESTIRAVDDFRGSKYVLGTINSVSALLQLAMDVAAIISVGRLSRLTTKGKQAIRGLAKMAENEFEKTVSVSVEKAINKEITKGVAKKTFEKLEDKQVSQLYESVLTGTKRAVEAAGRGNVTKKSLQQIARETANKEVEAAIRNTAENQAALETERILAGGIGEKISVKGASRISNAAKNKVWGIVEKTGKQFSITNREAAAAGKRARATELRAEGKKLMQEEYIIPYLAKTKYKPWKIFTWAGKHADGLTARALEGQAWTLEKSVSAQNWATRKFLGAKGKVSPYFRNTPMINVTKSNAYWWARATNVTGMVATELPGSWADRKMGSPLQKAQDYLDKLAAKKQENTGGLQVAEWQHEFNNVVSAMASLDASVPKDTIAARLSAYMGKTGLMGKPDDVKAATLKAWADGALPAGLLGEQKPARIEVEAETEAPKPAEKPKPGIRPK